MILIPVPLLVWAPYRITQSDPGGQLNSVLLSCAAFLPWTAGAVILLWSCWEFIFRGKGTPAPIDPPKVMVAQGLYRFVRNPMYLGALLVLAGQVLWFQSLRLLVYAAVLPLIFHLFVVLYGEPFLRRRFGDAYGQYCRKVPRWIPRIREKGNIGRKMPGDR